MNLPTIEHLENRTLLAAQITQHYFDNRGQAEFFFNKALDTSTLGRKSLGIYLAGADGDWGTSDDVRQTTAISYRKGRLVLSANLTKGTRYRVFLNAAKIKDVDGDFIDGEFRGILSTSGNGAAGGNFDIVTNNAAKTRARFTTPFGFINVNFFKNNTPKSKANFIHFADDAFWDGTIVHRSVRDNTLLNGVAQQIDVIQAGGFEVNAQNVVKKVDTHGHTGVPLELGNSNVAFTLAMARAAATNSGLEQWYFNVNDNTNLNTSSGGFAVFGIAADDASKNTIKALARFQIFKVNNFSPDDVESAGPPIKLRAQDTVPIRSLQAVSSRGGVISPKDDYIAFTRVAIIMDPQATSAAPSSLRAGPQAAFVAAPKFSTAKIDTSNSVLEDSE